MNKRSKIDPRVPRYNKLLTATLIALKKLGGSGKNDEILNQVISDLKIPDEVADIPHLGNSNLSELAYQLAWARTYLAKFGVIENSARSVWSIKPDYVGVGTLNEKEIVSTVNSIANSDLSVSFYHTLGTFRSLRITAAVRQITSYSLAICSTAYSGKFTSRSSFLKSAIDVRTAVSGANFS